ncbi:MAG: metallophosphoesterase [Proteobacteria bacterium]|nr:metallophosphoesterase [Pseudomonadota bacterium]MBU4472284.1 metallophosphoesterase [Pseudomonadota bacterium]MCG2751980.1 metallophosphoesterase [Desulfobacteraceae bacterium]
MKTNNSANKTMLMAWCFLVLAVLPVVAGHPESAEYREDNDRLFWFIQISDLHIGTSGSTDTDNLTWVVTEAKDVIRPEFIVATGDLTDSTNGGIIPNGPYLSEWSAYQAIVTDAGMTPDFFFDIPGNHDHYNDKNFSYYLNNSIQGISTGQTQASWQKDFSFGSYHFLAVNTAGNDGASFSISGPTYGDHAGLDREELDFIEDEFMAHQDADLTMVFGHHPLPQRPTGVSSDTYISYGDTQFINLMETYGVSMYAYGHTHQYREGLLPTDNSQSVLDLNIRPLGKDPLNGTYAYQVIAIDCNGIATAQQPAGIWPAVLITAPMDVKLGADENPYAYSVNDLNPKPIRALVFDKNPVTSMQYRIDGGTWNPMTHVNGPLWNALWNEPEILDKEHTLEVQATGSTTRSHTITIGVAETSPPAPQGSNAGGGGGGGCFIGSL